MFNLNWAKIKSLLLRRRSTGKVGDSSRLHICLIQSHKTLSIHFYVFRTKDFHWVEVITSKHIFKVNAIDMDKTLTEEKEIESILYII